MLPCLPRRVGWSSVGGHLSLVIAICKSGANPALQILPTGQTCHVPQRLLPYSIPGPERVRIGGHSATASNLPTVMPEANSEVPPENSTPPAADRTAIETEAPPAETATAEATSRRKILIGSQRKNEPQPPAETTADITTADVATADAATTGAAPQSTATDQQTPAPDQANPAVDSAVSSGDTAADSSPPNETAEAPTDTATNFPPPRLERRATPELEQEIADALGGESLDDIMAAEGRAGADQLEPESRLQGKVVGIYHENVIIDLAVRNQGVLPLKQFAEPPAVGAKLEVVVQRFDLDEGLYTLTMPGAAVTVGDWSQLAEGVIVEARITGHNKGGLECDVNHIRGFIPASQIDIYRVNDLEKYVGEKLACVVTEAKPQRKNLVLSHRALVEREREAAREKLLAELAPGQVREGVVRKLMDFGAFVDLGGVDGLIHISQLSWQRVNHPKDVLQEGQRLEVKVLKVDPQSGKIGLGLRDLLDDPWADVSTKFPPTSTHRGRVIKILQFGALVELDSGVSGLVHISELAHKHVRRVTEVVSEGQEVDVAVLSIDNEKRRIALSIKALSSAPEPEPAAEPDKPRRRLSDPSKLRGGIGGPSGGDQFGLKW